ncbi:MAG: bifunctional serine/threonine-protein kinase/formylglycine-generating enzyme family protein [Planctomycetes bacterium]|nr:bifunctional serine/threonine-protein kinase/formylglycine-generating enzyme family protein [Planctomycetota bacterium]
MRRTRRRGGAGDARGEWVGMASYSDILFGRIALGNRLVTAAQLSQALAAAGGRITLADALIQRGVLTREQAQRVQRAQALTQFMRAEKIYARILLERRLVDLAVLRDCFARQEQAQHRTRIGQILIERRLLTPEQSEEVVEEQLQRLAEETARIEEAGLGGELADSDDLGRQVEDLAKLRAAGDLEGSTFRRALGPRGLLDAPPTSGTAPGEVERTIEMSAPVGARTMVVGAPPYARPGPPPTAPERPASPPRPAAAVAAGTAAPGELVGRTIASRYRVLEKVGEGGMGTVYKAEHCLMEKIVALKVLNPGLISSKPSLERFRREIRAASKFQHKHVIQIYDAGEAEGGLFYMAMEYVAGQTLEDVLRADGALPIERVTRLLRQALGAVGEAHKKGIVHRDLKSGNIMLVTGKDGDDVVKVMDFGIAKIALESSDGSTDSGVGGLYKTQEGVVTGTPQYMSPEQCSGEAVDGRADLYSMGVILFEMLTGELPFKSNTPMGFLGKHIVEPPPAPSSVRPGLPRVLEDVTLRLLEKRPDARFQSAEEVLAALDAAPSSRRSEPRAPVGLTVEVPAPLAPEPEPQPQPQPQPQPTVAVPQVQPAPSPMPSPMPASAAAPSRAPLVLLVVGLAFVVLVATVATTVGLLLGGEGDHPALAKAAALLDGGDAAAAVALLEPVVRERPDDPAAADLLRRAREAAWTAVVQRADDLAGRWRQGRAPGDAAAGVEAFEAALAQHDDPQVRARLEQLRSEVAAHQRPPTPTTEAPPRPDPPKDPLGPGRAVLGTFEQALRAGRLDEAAARLEEAEALLPAGHTDLEVARRTLGAARSAAAAREARGAGDLARAQELLERALKEHPDRQQQGELRRELEAVAREASDRAAAEAAAAEREGLEAARDEALAAALAAAVALDLEAAQAALERAREPARKLADDAPVRARAQALQALAPLAPAVRAAEEQLRAAAEPADGGAVLAARLQSAMTRVDELRGRLAALAPDEPLATALHRRLSEALARGEQALARAQRPPERSTEDERLARFLRMVERVRELPDERETRVLVQDRLRRVQQLVEHPVYVTGGAPAEERAWVDERLRHWTARAEVWNDLGPRMVAIPGGAWTSPGGEEHALPDVYYAADAEVTCVEWDEFVRATGRARPRGFPGPTDEPVRLISLEDAQEYCRWRSRRPDGKPRRVEFRLPTEAEWERAARGAAGTEYPWGPSFEDWRARDGYAAVRGTLARVRSFQRDKNDWGLHDLVGNVQELTSTRRDGRLVVKGGSIAAALDQAGASAVRLVRPGDEVSPTIGLRVFAAER